MSFTFFARPVIAMLAFWGQVAFAYPPTGMMTVNQMFERIEESSPRLAKAKAELAASKSEYTSSRAIPNPEFVLSEERLEYPAGDEVERTIGVSQEISFLWAAPKHFHSQSARYEAAVTRYRQEKASIQCDALILLDQKDNLDRQISLASEISDKLAQVTSQLDARVKQGDISEYDGERFRQALLHFAGLRAELRETKSEVTLELMELTGLDAELLSNVSLGLNPLSLPFVNVTEALEYSTDHSFALIAARFESIAANRNVSARKWAMVPDVSLGFGRKEDGADVTGPVIEAQIEIPLLSQGRSELSLAKADQNSADLVFASGKNVVRQSIEEMWSQLEFVEADLRMFVGLSGNESADKAIQLYNFGEISSLEAVDMLQSIVETEKTLADLNTKQQTLIKGIAIACGYDLFEK